MANEVPVWERQYRNKVEAEEGIAETITSLFEKGVLVKNNSRWNTPILPETGYWKV